MLITLCKRNITCLGLQHMCIDWIVNIWRPIGCCLTEEGKTAETAKFYKQLQKNCDNIKNEYFVIAGDMNARVANQPSEEAIGTMGEHTINNNGR